MIQDKPLLWIENLTRATAYSIYIYIYLISQIKEQPRRTPAPDIYLIRIVYIALDLKTERNEIDSPRFASFVIRNPDDYCIVCIR